MASVVALLLTPASGAATVPGSGTLTFVPPFMNATKSQYFGPSAVGCAFENVAGPHTFNLKTGAVHFSGNASALNCSSQPRGAGVVDDFEFRQPINVSGSNLSRIANWTVKAHGNSSLNPGVCVRVNGTGRPVKCVQYAEAQVGILLLLVDNTNGSYLEGHPTSWTGGLFLRQYLGCATNCGPVQSRTFSIYRNVVLGVNASGLNPQHSYSVSMQLSCTVSVGLAGARYVIAGGSASAALSLATGPSGTRLNSITIF